MRVHLAFKTHRHAHAHAHHFLPTYIHAGTYARVRACMYMEIFFKYNKITKINTHTDFLTQRLWFFQIQFLKESELILQESEEKEE